MREQSSESRESEVQNLDSQDVLLFILTSALFFLTSDLCSLLYTNSLSGSLRSSR
jgi:hypothetical protein